MISWKRPDTYYFQSGCNTRGAEVSYPCEAREKDIAKC